MEEDLKQAESQPREEVKIVVDENPAITDGEKIPIHPPLKIIRYRTLKKNNALGWWSAVVLLEDHEKKQICFYRWRRRKGEWKRDKKLPFRSYTDWQDFKEAVEGFLEGLK